MSYTKNIEKKRKQKEEVMEGTNAETLEKLERLNIEDKGFNCIAKKLYIKYQNLKINLTEVGSQKSDTGPLISDLR